MSPIKIKAHEHELTYQKTEYSGENVWKCDACRKGSEELLQTHSYNCSSCNFDLCKECTKPIKTSKHPHNVVVTNDENMYGVGNWICNSCGADSTSQGE
jgi:ribosomal protein L37AE/L43A